MSIKRFSAQQEYIRDPELPRESVELLLEWVRKQPHLPNITEEDIILFLSSCYYRIEKAKYTVDEYYTCRTHVPEFFANRDPREKHSVAALKVACTVSLPGTTEEGYKVYFCRLLDANSSKFNFAAQAKCFFYHMDLSLIEEGASPGIRIVFDLTSATMGHVTRVNPVQLKKLIHYLLTALPVRLRSVHFIHPQSFMDRVLGLIRPLLPRATGDAIHVHNTIEDFHNVVPKKMLPLEAGGELPSVTALHAASVEKLLANRDWITSEEKLRVEESQRPGKAKTAGDLFGVEGSFKKLNID